MILIGEPNWIIVATFGAILGYLIPYIARLPIFLFRYLKNDDLHGSWYEYFLCMNQSGTVIYQYTFTIKIGINHKYLIIAKDEKMTYKGYGFIEHNNLIIKLVYDDKISKETSWLRFILPTVTNRNTMLGLWLSYDFNNNISSGISILSRTQLSQDEIWNLCGNVKKGNGPLMYIQQ